MKRSNERIRILDVPISHTNVAAAVSVILEWVATGASEYVCVRDVHGVMRARNSLDLVTIHEHAGMVTPDGMPLVWICQARGAKAVTRVCGPDLLDAVCAATQNTRIRHFFYGGKPGVADRLSSALQTRYPGLECVGTLSPPFESVSVGLDKEITDKICAKEPQIVWVGLSTPKQEFWMREHVGRIPGATLIGVGAAFDFHAGIIKRAPVWMQHSGLEWLYRFCSEPRRLWRRYLVLAPKFCVLVLAEQARYFLYQGIGTSGRVSK